MIPPSRLDTHGKVIPILSGKLRYGIEYKIITFFFKCFPSYVAVSLKSELQACTLLWSQLVPKKRESMLCMEI